MKSRLAWNWHFTVALLMATLLPDLSYGVVLCYFPDQEATSSNGRYHLTAKSPDNANPSSRTPFQSGFVYVLRDTKAGKDLWTRKQPKDKPIVDQTEEKPFVLRNWKEPPLVGFYVQDDGWSVLWSATDVLSVVRPDGKETGRLDILSQAFSKKEHEHYVHHELSGEMWGLTHSCFATHEGKSYFVVRTWWGHRIILDLESARLTPDAGTLAKRLEEADRVYVRTTLEAAAKNHDKWAECCDQRETPLMAIYMAGQMQMKECVPWLRAMEESPSNPSCIAVAGEQPKEGEVDVRCWEFFTDRQVLQLSLRRLGEVPRPVPTTQFQLYTKQNDRRSGIAKPFVPALAKPRAQQADAVRTGMRPTEVLRLIGAPDFIEGTWQYDMDGPKPYTLLVECRATGVKSVERKSPALWQNGDYRDQQVMNGITGIDMLPAPAR
jgi:hypothetical protein